MKKFSKLSALVLATSIMIPTVASANELTQSQEVQLSLTPGDFKLEVPTVSLNGEVKLKTEDTILNFTDPSLSLAVVDNRGTQEGWNLSVSATPFTEVTPPSGETAYVLPQGSFTLNNFNGLTADTNTQTSLPDSLKTGTYGINQVYNSNTLALDPTAGAINLFSAPAGTGAGKYNLTFNPNTLSLKVNSVTAKVRKGQASTSYKSTLTWNLVSGPVQ